MRSLAAFLLLVASAFGQSALVVPLDSETAVQAKKLYETKKAADDAWENFYFKVEKAHNGEGFLSGIEFSQDFHFIVPKLPNSSGTMTIGGFGGNCFYTAPAVTEPFHHTYIAPDGAEFSPGAVIVNATP